MALVILRSSFARSSSVGTLLGKQVHPLNGSKMAAVAPIQVATLKATYGEKYPYHPNPYPYEKKQYNIIREFLDFNTSKRLNENSKVIVVEGNLAVGKNDFARRLAKNFDLKYVEPVSEQDCFTWPDNGFDLRDLNEMLPDRAKFYDTKEWLKDSNLKRGEIGRTQLLWYRKKYESYCLAVTHMLNTGQGVVIPRSVFTDHVFTEAMKQMGYVTPNFLRYYYDIRDNSICELLRPHLTIYLDAPVTTIRNRINKRANEFEQNTKIVSDEYLTAMDAAYKNKFLPKARESGEVLEIDWTEVADDMDMEVIIEECQKLKLEAEDVDDTHCKDWYNLSEDMLCHYRKAFGSPFQIEQQFHRTQPLDCDEIIIPVDHQPIVERVVHEHPALKFAAGYAREFGHNAFIKH